MTALAQAPTQRTPIPAKRASIARSIRRCTRCISAAQMTASSVGAIAPPTVATRPSWPSLAANAPSRTPGHSRSPPRSIRPSATPAAGHTAMRPERTGSAQAMRTATAYSSATPSTRSTGVGSRSLTPVGVGTTPAGLRPAVRQLSSGAPVEPLAHRRVALGVLAGVQLVLELGQQPEALGHDVVLVDGLEVLLAGRDERARREGGQAVDDALDHLAHAVLHEPRAAVGLLDDGALVGALHHLVDLRGHRLLDDPQQLRSVDVGRPALGAADVQGAQPALVVGRHGDVLEDALDLVVVEAVRAQTLAGGPCDELLRARTGGHALGGDADQPARPGLGRDGRPEQRVELLRLDARDRRRLVLRVARGDGHLGPLGVLALAHDLGDPPGELLGPECGASQDDLADHVVDG